MEPDVCFHQFCHASNIDEAKGIIETIRNTIGFINWNSAVNSVRYMLDGESSSKLNPKQVDVLCQMFYEYRREIVPYCLHKFCDIMEDYTKKASFCSWSAFYTRLCRQYMTGVKRRRCANGNKNSELGKLPFIDSDHNQSIGNQILILLNKRPNDPKSNVPGELEPQPGVLTQEDKLKLFRDMEMDLPAEPDICDIDSYNTYNPSPEILSGGRAKADTDNSTHSTEKELTASQEECLQKLHEALHGRVDTANESESMHPLTQYTFTSNAEPYFEMRDAESEADQEEEEEASGAMLAELLASLSSEQIATRVIPRLRLPQLSPDATILFCQWLCALQPQQLSYATATTILCEALLHKFKTVTAVGVKREFNLAFSDACSKFPKAFSEAVLAEIFSSTELSLLEASFICKLLAEIVCQHGYVPLFLDIALSADVDWKVSHVVVLHTAVECSNLSDASVSRLCACIARNKENFVKNLKYMKLIVVCCSKYGNQFTHSDCALIQSATAINHTFLKKKVKQLVDDIQAGL